MHPEIARIQSMLDEQGYVADEALATSVYLAIQLRKPLLIEGAAGVGKTEVAKVMARALNTDLIRLQCYEGLDATTSLYEWNYQRQLLHIRLLEQSDKPLEAREREIFSEPFLLKRPLLAAITHHSSPVLLIDEIDRCVTSESLIATANGIKPAKSIRPGDVLISFNPREFRLMRSEVKKAIPRKSRALVRLLVGGRLLEVTPEHGFARYTDDKYEVVKASDLRVGDRLPLSKALLEVVPEDCSFDIADAIATLTEAGRRVLYRAYKTSEKTYAQLAEEAGVSRQHLSNVLRPNPHRHAFRSGVLRRLCASLGVEGFMGQPAYVRVLRLNPTPAFYELLGYLVADGCFTSARMCIADKDADTLTVYAEKFQEGFGLRPRIVPGPHANYELTFWSLPLGRFLKSMLGQALGRSRERIVPPFVFKLPAVKRAAFLRGYFDGEGWVSDHQVFASSASPYLLVGTQHLLASIGVESRITSSDQTDTAFGKGRFYTLGVTDLQGFQSMVGFCGPRKAGRLKRIARAQSFRRGETLPRELVVHALEKVRATRVLGTVPSHQTLYDILSRRIRPTVFSVSRLADAFGSPDLKELVDRQVVLGDVTMVETVASESAVYDFVLNGNPYFVANQIVTHNCDEEFEAFLLEVLSDWQITIPEIGTIKAQHIPHVVLTSNRTRELGDALRRRCLYLWIDYPIFDKELAIVRRKVPGVNGQLAEQIAAFMQFVRRTKLEKTPGLAETLDWSAALIALHRDHLDRDAVEQTLGVLFKQRDDAELMRTQWLDHLLRGIHEVGQEPIPWTQQTIDRVADRVLPKR
jgi:MoxR-like ATPase/intein/homing endonuclease